MVTAFFKKYLDSKHPLLTRKSLKTLLFSFWCVTLATVVMTYFSLNLSLAAILSEIRTLIAQQGMWGPVIYIFFYSFRSLLFFPASLLTILSGLLFGPVYGFLFTLIGENISANVSFLTGRYFMSGLGEYLHDKDPLFSRLLHCSQENGFITVLFMRLAYVPFDLVGYGSGLCQIRQRDFALGTFLGTIPGLLTFILLGSSVVDKKMLVFSLATFLISFFIAKRLKRETPVCFQTKPPEKLFQLKSLKGV